LLGRPRRPKKGEKMRRKIAVAVLLSVFVFVSGGYAFAQGVAPKVKYKRETTYDFDDDIVEGELQRPEGSIIDSRRKARHSSLIKIREHFILEILKSAESI
jgi:hypothetical protein